MIGQEFIMGKIKEEVGPILKSIVNDYLGASAYFKIQASKLKGKSKEYYGSDLKYYWSDLFGDYYAFYPAKKALNEGNGIIFRDVILTNWMPLSPGLYYSKSMWTSAPQEVRTLFKDIRFNEHNNKRILSIHYPKEFEAHWDLSKGIPVVVNNTAYKRIKGLIDAYGAVHLEEFRTTLSYMPTEIQDSIRFPQGYPKLTLTGEGMLCFKGPGTPDPLLGTAWNVCKTPNKEEALWYRFWVGTEEHEYYLCDANKRLDEMIRDKGGKAMFDFDEEIVRFPDAPLKPVGIVDFAKTRFAF